MTEHLLGGLRWRRNWRDRFCRPYIEESEESEHIGL